MYRHRYIYIYIYIHMCIHIYAGFYKGFTDVQAVWFRTYIGVLTVGDGVFKSLGCRVWSHSGSGFGF